MPQTAFDGRDIVKVLRSHGYQPVSRTGSHVKLRLDRPDLDQPRIVIVPLRSKDKIAPSTFHSIANQCGANDFHKWCEWIDDNR